MMERLKRIGTLAEMITQRTASCKAATDGRLAQNAGNGPTGRRGCTPSSVRPSPALLLPPPAPKSRFQNRFLGSDHSANRTFRCVPQTATPLPCARAGGGTSSTHDTPPGSSPFSASVLSLDGGGTRGAFSMRLLQRLVKEYPDLLDEIDIIAGTSTGACSCALRRCGRIRGAGRPPLATVEVS